MAAKRTTRSSRAAEAPILDRGIVRRTITAVAWVLLVVGALALWTFGMPRLTAMAAASAQPDDLQEIRFVDAPAWLKGEDLDRLAMLVRQNAGVDPLDRRGLVRARQALVDTGWFESVVQVRRVTRDRIEVTALYVEPYALVRDADGDHLVDRAGRLLSRTYPVDAGPALPILVNPTYERPRDFGTPWPGAEVDAAIRVLELTAARPWSHQVKAVDLAEFAESRRLLLVTDRDSLILWGRAPGAETAAEVPAARKLRFLDFHHSRHGHIDGGRPGMVNVTLDIAVEQPLTGDDLASSDG